MAQRPKAKPKKKGRRNTNTDKAQSARFIETARMLGADETGKKFEDALRVIAKPRVRKGDC